MIIWFGRTSVVKDLIVACFSSGPTESVAVFPSLFLSVLPFQFPSPSSFSLSFFPPFSTLFPSLSLSPPILSHPFPSLSLCVREWGRGTDRKREGVNDVSLSLNGFRCVPFLQGAVIGIDDEDDSTFTITVDQKTFHFQGEVSILLFFYGFCLVLLFSHLLFFGTSCRDAFNQCL